VVTLNAAFNYDRLWWQWPDWSFQNGQELEPIPSFLEAERPCCEEYEVNVPEDSAMSGTYVRQAELLNSVSKRIPENSEKNENFKIRKNVKIFLKILIFC